MYEMIKLRRASDPSFVDAETVEHAVVSQFAGSKVAKALRGNEQRLRVVDIGMRASDRRAAVMADNNVLSELVEAGWQPQPLASLFGFGSVVELNAWIRAAKLVDVYNEAVAASAEYFVDMMVSAYDNTTEIESRVMQLSADAVDVSTKSQLDAAALADEMTLQTKALDAVAKLGEKRLKLAEKMAALRNPAKYGVRAGDSGSGQNSTAPVVNIQMEFGAQGEPPREVKVVNAPPKLPGNIDLG